MDIHLLAVNVGNSRVAIGVFKHGELGLVQRVPVDDAEALTAAVEQAWADLGAYETAEICGSSVNPLAQEGVEHKIVAVTGKPVLWVGREIDLPIEVLTESPQQTGVDRVLNVAAAYEQMQKACVVVDAGTALTMDLCDDTGKFLGGAIAPGAGTMLDALNRRTARLPAVTLAVPAPGVGRSTEAAIRVGVWHGIRGMVKEVVEQYAEQLGTWPDLICTGGDSEVLFGGWELAHAVSPDLTLYGVALAYSEHHIKHDSE